jgi:hypothetical protein
VEKHRADLRDPSRTQLIGKVTFKQSRVNAPARAINEDMQLKQL